MSEQQTSPLRLVGGVLLLILVLALGLVGTILTQRTKLPKDPIISGISLAIPKPSKATSRPLVAYLAKPTPKLRMRLRPLWQSLIHKQGLYWPKPSALAKPLARLQKPLLSVLAGIRDEGCYPGPVSADFYSSRETLPAVRFFRGSKLLAFHAVSLTLQGKANEGAALLRALLARILDYQQHCPCTLVDAMIWLESKQLVRMFLSYPWAHPSLSSAERLRILKLLHRSATSKANPMQRAFRYEARAQKLLAMYETQASRNQNPFAFWPFWDRKETLLLLKRAFQVHTYKASLPYGPKFWEVTPTEKALLAPRTLSSWKSNLQYNTIGKTLLSRMFPAFHKFNPKWHGSRCLDAATQAYFVRKWKAVRARHLPTTQSSTKPTTPTKTRPINLPAEMHNPLTRKPFGKLPGVRCQVVHPRFKIPVYQGARLHSLPSVP